METTVEQSNNTPLFDTQEYEKRELAIRREAAEAITEKEMAGNVFRLAWPVTAEAILQTTIRIVTAALLGHIPVYSALAISASGLADRIIRLTWAVFAAIGTGSTVMIARSIGAGKKELANEFASQALVIGAGMFAIITAVVLFFPGQIINVLYNADRGLDAELVDMAVDYLRLISWSIPFMAANQIISALLRGAGNTIVGLITNTAANIVNVILGYILIYGQLGAPAMGIAGAAIATIISQGVGAAMAILIFFNIQDSLKVVFTRFRFHFVRIKDMFGIGVPHAFEMLLMQFGQVILAGLIGSMGAVELAAHTQGIIAESISYMPAMGFSIAATTLVGMSVGLGSVKLSMRYVRVLMKWNLILTAVTAAFLIIIPRRMFSLLSNDQDVIALGVVYLLIMGFCQFPQQSAGVLAGVLRGGGDNKVTLLISTIGLVVVRIPLCFIFANTFGWGIIGVWCAMSVDIVVRFLLFVLRYTGGKWKKTAILIAGGTDVQVSREPE